MVKGIVEKSIAEGKARKYFIEELGCVSDDCGSGRARGPNIDPEWKSFTTPTMVPVWRPYL
jgi:hypothetical protein